MKNSLSHIAFIMDGNNRWSKIKNVNKFQSYSKGANNLIKLSHNIFEKTEVKYITAFALSANNLKRSEIMYINNSNDLDKLKESLIYFYSKTKIKITYEYVLLNDFNDNIKDAQELIQFAKIVPSKINLIEFNNVENSKFKKSTEKKTKEFISMLKKENIIVNLRRSRGEDVNAACGQLANKI